MLKKKIKKEEEEKEGDAVIVEAWCIRVIKVTQGGIRIIGIFKRATACPRNGSGITVNLIQRCTVIKRRASNAGNGAGKSYGRQIRTILKRIAIDCCDAFRYSDG